MHLCTRPVDVNPQNPRARHLGVRRRHARVLPALRNEVVGHAVHGPHLLVGVGDGFRVPEGDGAAVVARVCEGRRGQDYAVEERGGHTDGHAARAVVKLHHARGNVPVQVDGGWGVGGRWGFGGGG